MVGTIYIVKKPNQTLEEVRHQDGVTELVRTADGLITS